MLTLGGKGRSRFLPKRLLQMLKIALKSFLFSCSDFLQKSFSALSMMLYNV